MRGTPGQTGELACEKVLLGGVVGDGDAEEVVGAVEDGRKPHHPEHAPYLLDAAGVSAAVTRALRALPLTGARTLAPAVSPPVTAGPAPVAPRRPVEHPRRRRASHIVLLSTVFAR